MRQKEEAPACRELTLLEPLQRPGTARVLHRPSVLDAESWYGLSAARTPKTDRALILVTCARRVLVDLARPRRDPVRLEAADRPILPRHRSPFRQDPDDITSRR